MSREPLREPPLVEYVFEVRWTHPNGWADLYEEYELTLGRLYDQLKDAGYSNILRMASMPREAYIQFARNDLITHRFLKTPLLADGQLTYPLIQFGPGVSTFNVNSSVYKWKHCRGEIIELFKKLFHIHENFLSRIQQISLKSVDFFECDDIAAFFGSGLNIKQESSLKTLDQIKDAEHAIEIPTFQTMIKLDKYDTTLAVRAIGGKVLNKDGLVLEITTSSLPHSVTIDNFEHLVDFMHGVTGDAFFALVSESEINARR